MRFRLSLTRMRFGTFRTPVAHRALLSLVSTRTSFVNIIFVANFFTSRMARGARFLKVCPWRSLCK